MYEWFAVWRCDQEETYMTDSGVYRLPTSLLSEAAAMVEQELSGLGTLISLKNTDI